MPDRRALLLKGADTRGRGVLRRIASCFTGVLTFALLFGAEADAAVISYRFIGGSDSGSPTRVDEGMVTTGSANLFFQTNAGLGVVGGGTSARVDAVGAAEFVEFDFASFAPGATFFSYNLNGASDPGAGNGGNGVFGERFAEAFDARGASLGSVSQSGIGVFEIVGSPSAAFGVQTVSRVRLTATNSDGFRVEEVTFEAGALVPEPVALLSIAGGAGIVAARRARFRAGGPSTTR